MAVVHACLREDIPPAEEGPTNCLDEEIDTGRPDLADMIEQVRTRIRQRNHTVAWHAMLHGSPWKRELQTEVGQDVPTGNWNSLLGRVAAYRDRWGIRGDVAPLGAPTAYYGWERANHRNQLEKDIAALATGRGARAGSLDAQLAGRTSPKPYVSVGLQL